jgi:hypothetical protein
MWRVFWNESKKRQYGLVQNSSGRCEHWPSIAAATPIAPAAPITSAIATAIAATPIAARAGMTLITVMAVAPAKVGYEIAT